MSPKETQTCLLSLCLSLFLMLRSRRSESVLACRCAARVALSRARYAKRISFGRASSFDLSYYMHSRLSACRRTRSETATCNRTSKPQKAISPDNFFDWTRLRAACLRRGIVLVARHHATNRSEDFLGFDTPPARRDAASSDDYVSIANESASRVGSTAEAAAADADLVN